ncbi:SDR family NAD(P)-dependent oxidoreductase, partial [Psychrobacter sp. T6-2]|uniref:SDR family NAD(P)-dependent oxidoreductase n=1 Tax=Psychrobacter sp. T6-2 TaxID=3457448 RepID=UPI003FD1AE27
KQVFTGPARVFDGEEACFEAVQSRTYKEGDVLVIRYEGPRGGPGMREMLSTTAALYGQGMGDKVALITGSSRGIGRAIALRMAEHGARVVISSRKREACDAVVAEIEAAHGPGRAVAIPASISVKAELEDLVAETEARLGPVDVLVCSAASNPYYGPLAGISDAQCRKILENNVLSNHWLIQMVAPG